MKEVKIDSPVKEDKKKKMRSSKSEIRINI